MDRELGVEPEDLADAEVVLPEPEVVVPEPEAVVPEPEVAEPDAVPEVVTDDTVASPRSPQEAAQAKFVEGMRQAEERRRQQIRLAMELKKSR